jgi:hypothetical protein
MFGRLDAAECLINTLVPSSNPDRSALLQRAQRAIILESLGPERQASVLGPGDPAGLPAGELVERFKANYRVADDLTPGTALPIAGRGLDVTGKMLKGISGQTGVLKTPVGWFARLGSLIARMVAVATPGSFKSLGFRHLVPVVVLFEALLTFLGWWLHSPSVLHLGVVTLVVTLLLGAFVYWLSGVIRGQGWPRRVARAALILLVGVVLALAAAEIVPNWRHPSQAGRDLYHTIRPSKTPAPTPARAP